MAIELILKSLFFFSAFQLHEAHVKSALGWEKSPKQQKILGKEKKKKKNQAINCIYRDLLTMRLRFYQDKGTGTQRIPSPSCAILCLLFVPGVFTASSAPTGLFSLHFSCFNSQRVNESFPNEISAGVNSLEADRSKGQAHPYNERKIKRGREKEPA